MLPLIAAAAGVLIILLVAELLWRTKVIKGEAARKFVHILVGSFVAFWPYFMSWRQIEIMSLAFLLVVLASMRFSVFNAIHSVTRKHRGEVLFPIGIGLAAVFAPSAIVFTAAILHLSLADGLAALVGQKAGSRHTYKIGASTKSVAGTLTFLLVSLIIITTTVLAAGGSLLLPLIIGLPLAATVVENIASPGTDNIFVPLLVVLVLSAANL